MKQTKILAAVIGMALLVAALACSAISPAEVAPTPNIDATEGKLVQKRPPELLITLANLHPSSHRGESMALPKAFTGGID